MNVIDDLSKIPDYRDPRSIQECDSLISKYNIPIDRFDFAYVEKCGDGKELEKILKILRSGEEGYYPELIKATEDRLRQIKPKSKLLRNQEPVLEKRDLKKEHVEEIDNDLKSFLKDAKKKDKELKSRKSKAQYTEVEIRKSQTGTTGDEKKNIEKPIASTDYSSWDKYDPDAEILKMDIEEELMKKEALQEKERKEKELKRKPKKTVTFNTFTTEAEALFVSEREREKGNEFYKTGDLNEALQCYTNSIQAKVTVNNLNNRALIYLILKKYKEALNDCNKVLALDKSNIKASLRKAEALDKLENYNEALDCIEFVIQKDPNNCRAQELADKLRKKTCKEVKNFRMKIVEIE